MMEIDAQLAGIARFLSEGAVERARAWIRDLSADKKLTRDQKLGLATLANRAHLPMRAALLLGRIVRPSDRKRSIATDVERAEYGTALVRLGATREGIELLQGVNARVAPQALHYLTMAHFRTWDWEAGTPLIERYLAEVKLTPPQRIDARSTLAAGLMYGVGRMDEAREILDEVLVETASPDQWALHFDALQLLCNLEILAGRFKEARATHSRVAEYAHEAGHPRMAQKARFLERLIALHTSKDRQAAVLEMRRMREEFRAEGYWEFARGCDNEIAVVAREPEAIHRVYFGTPFPGCRRKLLAKLGANAPEIPQDYVWSIDARADGPPKRHVRASNGENSFGKAFLKEGQLLQRAFAAFCSDFYRPLRIAELHAATYPENYFNPDYSPAQIHQAIQRLRVWFEESNVPLDIVHENETYRLAAKASCGVVVSRPGASAVPVRLKRFIEALRRSCGEGEFSNQEAAKALKMPSRTCVRNLKAVKELGLLAQTGSGPSARYRWI